MEPTESIEKKESAESKSKGVLLNKLIVRPTRITPLVYFDPNRGLLELRGRSSPENAITFYGDLLEGIEQFAKEGSKNLMANFKYEYFNTSSSKCIFDVFKKVLLVKAHGRKISINWYYEVEDDDMLEAGEDYADLLGESFNYIETTFD